MFCYWSAAEKIMHCSVPSKPIYYNTVLIIFLKFQTRSLRFLTFWLQKHLFPTHSLCFKSHWVFSHVLKYISIIHFLMTLYIWFPFSEILWPSYPMVNFSHPSNYFIPYLWHLPEFHQTESVLPSVILSYFAFFFHNFHWILFSIYISVSLIKLHTISYHLIPLFICPNLSIVWPIVNAQEMITD